MADNNSRINEKKYNSVTEGNLLYAFIMFIIPLIGANLLQQSYSIADGLILGNAISQEALGSVSSVSPVIDMCTIIQLGISGGCSITLSHLFGAGKYGDVNRLITDIRRLLTIISVIIAAAAFAAAPKLLTMMHTPDNLMSGALTYIRITFIGMPFIVLYGLQSGILRGMGDSKRPLGGIAVSSIVNIGMDLLFVVALGMGIAGAAVATVSAEAMSAAYLFKKIEDKKKLFRSEETGSGRENLRECIRLGAPQIIQSAAYSGGKVLLQNITNILGGFVVIGVAVAFKIDAILMTPLMSIGIAVAVFTGQNIGSGNHQRVRETVKYGIALAVSVTVAASLVLWLFGLPLFSLFGLDNETAETGFRYIVLCLPFYWIFGMQFVLNGYLNGSKHTALTSGAAIAGLACRVLFAYAGAAHFGADVLPLAEALSWVIAVAVDACGLLFFRNRNISNKGEQD